jgi:CRP-like cAMP-binding protein
MTVFAPRAWPALKINREQGLHWEWFMTQHALAEPALFYVRLLFASGDLVRENAIPSKIIMWLHYQAVKTINEALSEPARATSDALILAVGRIALHECLYGDRETSNRIHRPAQARMIAMRGGIDALNFPPLVKRLMRWSDDIMARQGGTQRFLEVGDESQNFTLTERIKALESWVPPEPESSRSNSIISEVTDESASIASGSVESSR